MRRSCGQKSPLAASVVTDSEKNTLGGHLVFAFSSHIRPISGYGTGFNPGPLNCIEIPFADGCVDATGRNLIWFLAQREIRSIRLRKVSLTSGEDAMQCIYGVRRPAVWTSVPLSEV